MFLLHELILSSSVLSRAVEMRVTEGSEIPLYRHITTLFIPWRPCVSSEMKSVTPILFFFVPADFDERAEQLCIKAAGHSKDN